MPDATVVVLNSVALRSKAADAIRNLNAKVVEVYRDHDPAGEQLVSFLKTALPECEIVDKSALYAGYDDLNDWHAKTSRVNSTCVHG